MALVSYSDSYIILASLGSVLFGYGISVLNTIINFIALEFEWCGDTNDYTCPEAKQKIAMTSMMVFVGAAIGSFLAGGLVTRGRKFGLLITHMTSILGTVVSVFAMSGMVLGVGRFIFGLCVGFVTVAVPTFISEMATDKTRGSRGVFHQFGITIGILLGIAMGLPLRQPPAVPDVLYVMPSFEQKYIRLMLALPGFISAVCLVLHLTVFPDDTPQALAERDNEAAARVLIGKIYGREQEEAKFLALIQSINDSRLTNVQSMGLLSAITDKCYLTAILVGSLLSIGQQFSGISVFVAMSTGLFNDAGMSAEMAPAASAGVGLVNMLMTIPAMFVIDTLGRRRLMLLGCFGMALFLSIVPVVQLIPSLADSAPLLSVVSVVGYIVFFAVSYGPVLWVYLFEIYPPEIKGIASGLASGLNWVAAAMVVGLNGLFQGPEYSFAKFLTFAIVCYFFTGFIYLFMRESKGRPSTASPYMVDERGKPLSRVAVDAPVNEKTRLV